MASQVENIISWYSTASPDQKNNLSQILNYGRLAGSGKMVILPIDQHIEHGPGRTFEPHPELYDPVMQAQLAVDGGVNAYAAPLGSLERAFEITQEHQLPTILKVNSHHLMIPDDENPKLSVHSWVDDAVRLGCVGVGFTLYPGSKHSNEMEEQAAALIADARQAGLIVVLWVYPRGEGVISGKETATDVIAYGAALGANLGAHIIKVKLPQTDDYGLPSNRKRDIYGQVDTSSLRGRVKLVMKAAYNGHRLVIHSGGATKEETELYEEIRALRDGGAFGSIMGRNVIQRPYQEGVDILHQVQNILIHKDR